MKRLKIFRYIQEMFFVVVILLSLPIFAFADSIKATTYDVESIPMFEEYTWVTLNKNEPIFPDELLTISPYVQLSPLDELGRPGTVIACVGPETILADYDYTPTRDSYKPCGWQDIKNATSPLPLYVCTRLIEPCLYPGLDVAENFITATSTMNSWELFPFENGVYNYIKETGNHVILRLTPFYEGNNLLCTGVLIEEWSVEEPPADYTSTRQRAFVYNAATYMTIDYRTGEAWPNDQGKDPMGINSLLYKQPNGLSKQRTEETVVPQITYVLNTNTKKFHYPTCASVSEMKPSNRSDYTGTRDEIMSMGYSPCGRCKP